jgi:hypothetical protein
MGKCFVQQLILALQHTLYTMDIVEKKKAPGDEHLPPYISHIASIKMCTWPHIGRRLESNISNGYVYAIEELGTTMVFIGWGSRVSLKEKVVRLQNGNPRRLRILCVMQRSNVYDANEICSFIRRGIYAHSVRGDWFDIEQNNVLSIFKAVDKLH